MQKMRGWNYYTVVSNNVLHIWTSAVSSSEKLRVPAQFTTGLIVADLRLTYLHSFAFRCKGLPGLIQTTVYPKKYAHGFVVLCFVVVMQSFIMNSHEVFIHIHQGCFAGTGAIVRLPQCQWSKPDVYGKIGQCITTTKHSKAVTVCIFLGIYCII